MKITGAEWAQFQENGWPEGYIWAEESVLPDGRDIDEHPPGPDEVFVIPPDWRMSLEEGQQHPKDGGYGMSMRSMVNLWRKAQSTAMLVVEVPRAALDEARAMMADKGWKVL